MLKSYRLVLITALILIVTLALYGCGGGSKNTSRVYVATQAPGDHWEWKLTRPANTFEAKNYGDDLNHTLKNTYGGTFIELPSGFLKITLTSSDDPEAPVGSVAYALEIPNTVLLVKPAAENNGAICGVPIGGSLVAGRSYNWVTIPHSGFNELNDVAYGISNITSVSSPGFTVNNTSKKWDHSVHSSGFESGECFNGKIYFPDATNPEGIGNMAPTGCFVADQGTYGGLFGAIQPASNINIADIVSKNFKGYAGVYGVTVDVFPISISKDPADLTNKKMIGGGYVGQNPENPYDATTEATVDFTNAQQTTPGLFTGVTTDNGAGHTQEMISVVAVVSGKYVLFGFGKDSDGKWFNYLAMEK